MAKRGRPPKTKTPIASAPSPIPSKPESEPLTAPPLPLLTDPPAETPDPAEQPSTKDTRKVLAVRLMPDGSIDFTGMREETRKRLEAAIAKLPAKVIEDKQPLFSANEVDFLLTAVGKLHAFSAKLAGVPAEAATVIFDFNEAEKLELGPPTQAVLERYLDKPEWLKKHEELFGLLFVLGTIEIGKFNAYRQFVADRLAEEEKKKKAAPAPAPRPNGSGVALDSQFKPETVELGS